jgi:SagB-type dehydrogenase family enzyme
VKKKLLVRRASHVVAYWRGQQLIFENYATATRVTADPVALSILACFDDWLEPAVLVERLPGYTARSLAKAVDDLIRHSFLDRSDRPSADRGFGSWDSWHPAAALMHFSSKDVAYQDRRHVNQALRRRARSQPMPAPVKRYADAKRVALARPDRNGSFPAVLLGRRTWRRFSSRPVSFSAISTILGLTCAVQHWVDLPGRGRVPLKTHPSGGSRHPLEVYVLARHVSGLAPGLYHYASDTHELELLRRGATANQIATYLPTQSWFRSASALFLMTAVFPRTQWKYRFSRAYRAVLTESGHLCQSICLTATWLGLAPFCTLALADSKIERDLKIDGVTESMLYAAGIGTKPSDVNWAPVASGPRLHRTTNRLGARR